MFVIGVSSSDVGRITVLITANVPFLVVKKEPKLCEDLHDIHHPPSPNTCYIIAVNLE